MEYFDNLETDQVIRPYPCEDDDGKLEYITQHPFVRTEECQDCGDTPCWCSDSNTKAHLYECTLCKRSDMSKSAAKHHLREPAHLERMEQARNQREIFAAVFIRWDALYLEPKLKRLKGEDGLSLPDNVLAAAFRYIKTNAGPWCDKQGFKTQAIALLEKYENMERLSLLYLAVWKTECLSQMPEVVHTFSSAQQWFSSGWKERKAQERKSGAMHTIVSLVNPFLE
jgi:hypothetical protein